MFNESNHKYNIHFQLYHKDIHINGKSITIIQITKNFDLYYN